MEREVGRTRKSSRKRARDRMDRTWRKQKSKGQGTVAATFSCQHRQQWRADRAMMVSQRPSQPASEGEFFAVTGRMNQAKDAQHFETSPIQKKVRATWASQPDQGLAERPTGKEESRKNSGQTRQAKVKRNDEKRQRSRTTPSIALSLQGKGTAHA